MRAFRSHTAALPLLSHPIELVRNQLGRWVAGLEPPSAASGALPPRGATSELRVATTDTPLPLVLAWLSEAEGPGSVPVVEPGTGALVDLYSRADILSLAHGSAYGALQSQWETSTVSHALSLARLPPARDPGIGLLTAQAGLVETRTVPQVQVGAGERTFVVLRTVK